MWSSWVQGNSDGPLVPMVRLVPMECISLRELDYFLMWSGWVKCNSNGPLVRKERLVPIENDVIPVVLLLSPGPHRKLQPRKEHGKYNLSTTTLTIKDINGFTITLIIANCCTSMGYHDKPHVNSQK